MAAGVGMAKCGGSRVHGSRTCGSSPLTVAEVLAVTGNGKRGIWHWSCCHRGRKLGLGRWLWSLGELCDGSGWLEGLEWFGTFAWAAVHNGSAKGAPTGPKVVVVSR